MKRTTVVSEQVVHIVSVGEQGPAGAGGGGEGVAREPVSVFNGGSPEIVFTKDGDVVTNDVT